MEQLKRKEQILMKQNERKEKEIINNFKNLRFYGFVDEEITNKIKSVLQDVNSCDAEPEKIIMKENEYKRNIYNLKNVIEKIQRRGKWLIPSPVDASKKWYEVGSDNISFGIEELFGIYGADFLTIILKEKNFLIDVFWDEEYNGIYSPLGIYCIFRLISALQRPSWSSIKHI